MKVNLIFPRLQDSADCFFARSLFSDGVRHLLKMGATNHTPPLSLMYLAAVTPSDVCIRLVDERFEEVNFDRPVDLVGISVVTHATHRAYRISEEYRRRGVKVVLGGIHPSVMQDEALMHAAAIVVGEGEGVWPELLDDVRSGNLKRVYRGGSVNFSALPWPRRDIISSSKHKYLTQKVMTATRGCPRSCTFCSVGFGVSKRYRTREVGDVVAEIKATPGSIVYFTDENLGCDVEYTKSLLRALIPLRIKWYGEIELAALEDQELVDLIAKSGCVSLQTGFDSLSADVIESVKKKKTNNPSRYREIVRRLHKAGIVVAGSFIVGFDLDTKTVFQEIIDFIDECLAIQGVLLEHGWQLARLPNSPVIRIRFTFFDEPTNPYRSECFFNITSQEDKEILQTLTELPYFNIACFDMENQFVWGRRYNHRELQREELKQLIEKAEQHLETIPQSVRDFDVAKEEFMRRYPLFA